MAFRSRRTPEALLPRSDSKNPATTCKGITSNGRPCRRSLGQSTQASATAETIAPHHRDGVLAVVPNINGSKQSVAAFYCWQHRDQAEALTHNQDDATEIVNLQSRRSTDSLSARLGILTIEEEPEAPQRIHRSRQHPSSVRRQTLPKTWQTVTSPLMTVPDRQLPPKSDTRHQPSARRQNRRSGDVHVSFFCCMRTDQLIDEDLTAPKPIHPDKQIRLTYSQPAIGLSAGCKPRADALGSAPRKPSFPSSSSSSSPPRASVTASLSTSVLPGCSTNPSNSAYTEALRSFIPQHLSKTAKDLLFLELTKPLSQADKEPGYIYIFWLTPRSGPQPVTSDASSLLDPPRRSDPQDQRTNDMMRKFSVRQPETSARRTLMLKIGRASNVHRRMVEWSRQCGHHITLLRYYPTIAQSGAMSAGNSPAPSPGRSMRAWPHSTQITVQRDDEFAPSDGSPSVDPLPCKVPLVARIERLIHAELSDQRVLRDCDGCARQHREWFAVDASRAGVRAMDETVRRWVEWGIEEGKGM